MSLTFIWILLHIILPAFIGFIVAYRRWRWHTLLLVITAYSIVAVAVERYLLK